ncbi:MAG: BrnA antitoxin family protein [Betaproteobacteria bacterium]
MHIVRGIVREGLKPVPAKVAISLRVDVDVLEWSRAQGPGYGKHRPGSPREGSGNCPTVQRSNVPDTKLPSKVKLGDATLVPSFLGHYWLTGKPAFQNSKWAILDYSAAANGPVVAYRWNGEAALSNAGFVEAVG